jgi:hypothetical protein
MPPAAGSRNSGAGLRDMTTGLFGVAPTTELRHGIEMMRRRADGCWKACTDHPWRDEPPWAMDDAAAVPAGRCGRPHPTRSEGASP